VAVNEPEAYGTDIRCFNDADAFWSSVAGISSVEQDAYHRITADDVCGPGGVGWGLDCRRLLGMPAGQLPAQQALFQEALLRDERISEAEVTITQTTRAGGQTDVVLAVRCVTAAGPFDFVVSVLDLTSDMIERQG